MGDLAVQQPHLGQESIAILARIVASEADGVTQDDIPPYLLVRLLRCGYIRRQQADAAVFVATPTGIARARHEAAVARRRQEDEERREIIRGRVQTMVDRMIEARPPPPPVPTLRDLPGYRERSLSPLSQAPAPPRLSPKPVVRPPEYRDLPPMEDALLAIRAASQRARQELEAFAPTGLPSAGGAALPVVRVERLPTSRGDDPAAGDPVPVPLPELASEVLDGLPAGAEVPYEARPAGGKAWRGGAAAAAVAMAGGALLIVGVLQPQQPPANGGGPAAPGLPQFGPASAAASGAQQAAAEPAHVPPEPDRKTAAAAQPHRTAPEQRRQEFAALQQSARPGGARLPLPPPVPDASMEAAPTAPPQDTVTAAAPPAARPEAPAPWPEPSPAASSGQHEAASPDGAVVTQAATQSAATNPPAAVATHASDTPNPADPARMSQVAQLQPRESPSPAATMVAAAQPAAAIEQHSAASAERVAAAAAAALQPASRSAPTAPAAAASASDTASPDHPTEPARTHPSRHHATPMGAHEQSAEVALLLAGQPGPELPILSPATPKPAAEVLPPGQQATAEPKPAARHVKPAEAVRALPPPPAPPGPMQTASAAKVPGDKAADAKPLEGKAAGTAPDAKATATSPDGKAAAASSEGKSTVAGSKTAEMQVGLLAQVMARLRAGEFSDDSAVDMLNMLSLHAAMAGKTFSPIVARRGRGTAHGRAAAQSAATVAAAFEP